MEAQSTQANVKATCKVNIEIKQRYLGGNIYIYIYMYICENLFSILRNLIYKPTY